MSCAKQLVIAIIVNKGKFWVGSNYCFNEQEVCPRGDLPSGEGYEMCKEICEQPCHAEVEACESAGKKARDGTLYLIGHTFCCDNCMKVMKKHGIKEVLICDTNERITL